MREILFLYLFAKKKLGPRCKIPQNNFTQGTILRHKLIIELSMSCPSFVKNTVNAKTKRIGSSIICIPIMCIFVLPVVFGLTYYVIILYCWFIGATPYQTFSMIDPKYLDYDVII